MPIATVTIKNFAKLLEAKTELVCPKCNRKPTWIGGYTCTCCSKCGKPMEAVVVDEKGTIQYKCSEDGWQEPSYYKTWQSLKRILPDGTELKKEKLTGEGDVEADAYIMDLPEFSKYADATMTEYGVLVRDSTSALNLKKLLIAMHNLGKVIILHFNDTYEERVCILTTSISNRIILKELIPLNLADIQETMKVSFEGLTDKDIAEAETFIKQLPKATEDILYVHDYRLKGIEVPQVSPKVLELEQILTKMEKEKAIA
jgi:hypothetical protein